MTDKHRIVTSVSLVGNQTRLATPMDSILHLLFMSHVGAVAILDSVQVGASRKCSLRVLLIERVCRRLINESIELLQAMINATKRAADNVCAR